MSRVSPHKKLAADLKEWFIVTVSKDGIAKIIAKWKQLSGNEDQYRDNFWTCRETTVLAEIPHDLDDHKSTDKPHEV